MAPTTAPPPVDPKARAKKELARRELCRRSFLHYYQACYPSYTIGWFIRLLCAVLQRFAERVEAGQRPRLMVFVPPQHGKSECIGRAFQAWMLGRHPEWPLILASYAASLSHGHGRWVRNRLRSPAHLQIFPKSELAEDSQAVDHFHLAKGGKMKSVGCDGGVSGQPGKVLTIDDPFAGRDEADSETIRNKRWEWYQTDFRTRLADGGGICILNTRWHTDDLCGKLLEKAKSRTDDNVDRWEVVHFPAIAEEDEQYRRKGEALFPELKSLRDLLSMKGDLSPRNWLSVYQQNPSDEQGSYYKAEHLRTYTGQPPKHCRNYVTTDLALGKKKENDWTVILPGGVDPNDDLYILPRIIRGRMGSLEICCRLLLLAIDINAEFIALPNDVIGKSLHPILERMMEGTKDEKPFKFGDEKLTVPKCSFHIEWMPVSEDKPARGRSFQGWQERGKVYWPAGEMWNDIVRPELLAFPTGKHDDLCDAAADFGLLLENLTKGKKPDKPKTENPDKKRWAEIDRRKSQNTTAAIKPLFGG
jgi:hypothetical protein